MTDCAAFGCNNLAVATSYHHHHEGNTNDCKIRDWDANHCVFDYCESHYNRTGKNNASLKLKYSKNGRHMDRVIHVTPANQEGITYRVSHSEIVGGGPS